MGDDKKVVLLPRTVDYYQVQLTKMLENEQYLEATELLTFLLACESEDARISEEWAALLSWLQDQFVHITDQEINELDLLDDHVKRKWSNDQHYAHKLVKMLTETDSLEHQLLALEQLAFTPDPVLAEKITSWLEQEEQNPLAQFKALQVLKQQHVTEPIQMIRLGQQVKLRPMDTPLKLEEFPEPVHHVLDLVREQSEINHPNLLYFAEHTWADFLSFIYGSVQYERFIQHAVAYPYACAASLHYISLQAMTGDASQFEVADMYDVAEDDFSLEWVGRLLNQFIQRA